MARRAFRRPRPGSAAALRIAALAGLTGIVICTALADVPGVGAVGRVLRPVSGALGLEQNWRVFAPEPRRDGVRIVGLIDWSDGSRTEWRPPSPGSGLGAYRDYRWRKWEEHASSDAEGRRLWPAAARFIARLLPHRGRVKPVALHLMRYLQPVPRPGSGAPARWEGTEVYRARLVER